MFIEGRINGKASDKIFHLIHGHCEVSKVKVDFYQFYLCV